MRTDIELKSAIYRHIATTARVPRAVELARDGNGSESEVREALLRLRQQRVLFLEPDGEIRMAPPFSAVSTQHRVRAAGKDYFANCAWDALGVPAALHANGEVRSRCEQSGEPLELEVGAEGPAASPFVAHFAVPAAHWWRDLVYT